MTWHRWCLPVFLFVASACSAGSEKNADYNTVPRGVAPTPGTPAYLSTTRGTRSLINPTRQFVAYIASARRFSVIDQASESEAYSIKYPGPVSTAFPIAQFDGIGSLNEQGLTVFSGGLQRNFSFPYSGLAWDIAAASPALAFATGNGVQLIRYLEADQWQNATLSDLAAGGAQIPLLRADGLAMIVIRPADGHYASYHANQSNTPMTIRRTCEPAANINMPIVAMVVQGSRLLWGTQQGELGAIDITTSECEELTPLASLALGKEIARILPRHDSSILILTIGGQVYDWDGGSSIREFSLLDDCDFALAATLLADDDLAALCLNDLAQPVESERIRYRRASYRYFAKSKAGIDFANVAALDKLEQMAIDAQSKRAFFFDDAALGHLKVIDLTNNQNRWHKGVFVKNILQQ